MSFRDQVEARLRAFKIDAGVLDTVQRRARACAAAPVRP
jgi:hypothetical protein